MPLIIKPELRPCRVNGEPGLFHKWAEKEKIIYQTNCYLTRENKSAILENIYHEGFIPPGINVDKTHETFALIEFKDGHIEYVQPEKIRFCDEQVKTAFQEGVYK